MPTKDARRHGGFLWRSAEAKGSGARFQEKSFFLLLCLFYGNVSPGSRMDHDILAWIMMPLHGP